MVLGEDGQHVAGLDASLAQQVGEAVGGGIEIAERRQLAGAGHDHGWSVCCLAGDGGRVHVGPPSVEWRCLLNLSN